MGVMKGSTMKLFRTDGKLDAYPEPCPTCEGWKRLVVELTAEKYMAEAEVDRLRAELKQSRVSVLKEAIGYVRTTGVSEPLAGWAPEGYYHERMIGLGCAVEVLERMLADEGENHE